jgi:2-haloacid dehalogenase
LTTVSDEQPILAAEVVFFDVVETLFSLEPVRSRLGAVGAGEGALELWFARFLRDGFAIAASGGYRPFREVAASTLRGVLRERGVDPEEDRIDHILGGLAELEPYSDVRPALEHLQSRGARAMTLSNGGVEATERLLTRAGLRPLIEVMPSVEETRAWKPRPEPYLAACRAAGVVPDRAAFVAVHSWDVHGAAAAGLRTGWCSRLESAFPPAFIPPTVRGATLVEVVEQLR